MGSSQTKGKSISPSEKAVEDLKNKVRLLQGEISEVTAMREAENEAYERELTVFAFKQGEWRRERKRLKEQVERLMKKGGGSEEEEREDEAPFSWREATVEKWKNLYFAIKFELDDLIERTHQEAKNVEEEDAVVMELKKELRCREEKVKLLQAKLASMEDQQRRREREMDILRQSLRIVSHRKKAAAAANRKTSRPRTC